MTRKEKIEKLLILVKDPSSSKEEIDLLYDSYKKDVEIGLFESQKRVTDLEKSLRDKTIDRILNS
jgi:hypothetical protein